MKLHLLEDFVLKIFDSIIFFITVIKFLCVKCKAGLCTHIQVPYTIIPLKCLRDKFQTDFCDVI